MNYLAEFFRALKKALLWMLTGVKSRNSSQNSFWKLTQELYLEISRGTPGGFLQETPRIIKKTILKDSQKDQRKDYHKELISRDF